MKTAYSHDNPCNNAIIRNHGGIFPRLALAAALLFACGSIHAQTAEGTSQMVPGSSFIDIQKKVAIKAPAWYSFRNDYADTFDDADTGKTTLEYTDEDGNPVEVQTAHTYVDTIYVHKGTTTKLFLPFISPSSQNESDMKGYYRWFNYRTGGNFYIGDASITRQATFTIYFDNSSVSWGSVCAWVYDADGNSLNSNTNWPGDVLSPNGNTWTWTYTGTAIPAYVMFNDNNNGNQTNQFACLNGGTYNQNGLTYSLSSNWSYPDLLTQAYGDVSTDPYYYDHVEYGYSYWGYHAYCHYRYDNGYVGGKYTAGTGLKDYGGQYSNAFSRAFFYYPTDDEYDILTNSGNKSFNGSKDSKTGNDYYIVACDFSNYQDFGESGSIGNDGSYFISFDLTGSGWESVVFHVLDSNGDEITTGSTSNDSNMYTWSYIISEEKVPTQVYFSNSADSDDISETYTFINGSTYYFENESEGEKTDYCVYFDNSTTNWGTVYAYVWYEGDDIQEKYHTGTYGDVMTEVGDGIYKWVFTGTIREGAQILFDNGSFGTNQTEDFDFIDGYLYTASGDFGAYEDYTEYNVYFDTTGTSWSGTVYAYVYNNSGDISAAWHGDACENVTGNIWCWTKKTFQVPTYVFFNNGGSGSGNQYPSSAGDGFSFTDGGLYTMDGYSSMYTQAKGMAKAKAKGKAKLSVKMPASGAAKVKVSSSTTGFEGTFDASSPAEPTLMDRVLFYIVAIDDLTDNEYNCEGEEQETEDAKLPELFRGHMKKFDKCNIEDYINDGDKYLEEYNITFPNRHSAKSDEIVGLSKDARAYVVPEGEQIQMSPEEVFSNLDFSDGSSGWEIDTHGLTKVGVYPTASNANLSSTYGTTGSNCCVIYNDGYDYGGSVTWLEKTVTLPADIYYNYTFSVTLYLSSESSGHVTFSVTANGSTVGSQTISTSGKSTTNLTLSSTFSEATNVTLSISSSNIDSDRLNISGEGGLFIIIDKFSIDGNDVYMNLGSGDSASIPLNVEVEETNPCIKITNENNQLIYFERAITFTAASNVNSFTGAESETQWDVSDGSTATILVTKTVGGVKYHIARYNLTFSEEHIPLTNAQVNCIDKAYAPDEGSAAATYTYWWTDEKYKYRSPKYMAENFTLLTSLTFEYSENVTSNNIYGMNESGGVSDYFYAFPIKWSYTGYGFNAGNISFSGYTNSGSDGVVATVPNYNENGIYFLPDQERVNAAQYALMKGYYGYDDGFIYSYYNSAKTTHNVATGLAKSDDGYWMYVDGTQTPGIIAELPIEDNLCEGTKLYCIAWMKGANFEEWHSGTPDYTTYRDDSSVIMTIKGYDSDGIANDIASFSSGQIRRTDGISVYKGTNYNEESATFTDVHKGWRADCNDWVQVFFTFTVDGEYDYDHYTLQLKNYSASSDGADFYVDDIRVYVSHPSFDVTQLEPICQEDMPGKVRVDFDYSTLELYVSDSDSNDEDSEGYVDFVIIQESKYNEFYETNKDESKYNPSGVFDEESLIEAAIEASAVDIYLEDESTSAGKRITAMFHDMFSANRAYSTNKGADGMPNNLLLATTSLTTKDESAHFLYRRESEGTKYLSFDCWADLLPYVAYKFIAVPHHYESGSLDNTYVPSWKEFAEQLENTCSRTKEFYVISTTLVNINGDLVDPTATYCAGRTNNISVHINYFSTTEDNPTAEELIESYCDFFYGTEDEYIAANFNYGDVSLYEAMKAFRAYYPDVEDQDLYGVTTVSSGDTDVYDATYGEFTSDMLSIIKHYISEGKLYLYQVTTSIYADAEKGMNVVIQPIAVAAINDDTNINICFGYIPLQLNTYDTTNSPMLLLGYDNMWYPSTNYSPSIRIGLSQLDNVSTSISKNHAEKALTVSLRGAALTTEYFIDDNGDYILDEETNEPKTAASGDADFQGKKLGPLYGEIYLVETDDPYYHNSEYLDRYDYSSDDNGLYTDSPCKYTDSSVTVYESVSLEYPVGNIVSLVGTPIEDGSSSGSSVIDDNNMMEIRFNVNKYPFSEGHLYVMMVYIEQEDEDGNAVNTYCTGVFPLELKVVPKYLVWQGDDYKDNWNRDRAWKRADREDLLLYDKKKDSEATQNAENLTEGYAYDKDIKERTKYSEELDEEYENTESTQRGYVPMLFSNALIPSGNRAQLYMAGFAEYNSEKDGGNDDTDNSKAEKYVWRGDNESTFNRPETMERMPTDSIMYDLMTYEKITYGEDNDITGDDYITAPFRVNVCNELQLASKQYEKDGNDYKQTAADAQVLYSELMLYNKVSTDVLIPTTEWTLVSTPLQNVYAGEWYTNMPARGKAPYFSDITFNEADNDRYEPLVYQRSWADNGNIVHMNEDIKPAIGSNIHEQSVASYDATGWTSALNDMSEEFVPGAGYSIKTYTKAESGTDGDGVSVEESDVETYYNKSLEYLTFRLPKSDSEYNYYDWNSGSSEDGGGGGTIYKQGYSSADDMKLSDIHDDTFGTLFVSKFVTRKEDTNADTEGVYDKDGTSTTEKASEAKAITITLPAKAAEVSLTPEGGSETDQTIYYALVGNPFTANMSLKAFMEGNKGDIKGYWVEEKSGSTFAPDDNTTYDFVSNPVGPIFGATEGGNSWGIDDCYLEPYGAFFVMAMAKATKDADGETITEGDFINVSFTPDMQVLQIDEESTTPSKLTTFSIRAKSEAGTTSAAISYGDAASDEYDPDEDVILLRDASWYSDKLPMVYTVAGEKAVGVNRLKAQTVIPIGVELADSCSYTLTFAGVDNLDSPMLYDAADETETPITEGFTLNMSGASHGRYFIRTANIEEHGIEEDVAEYSITAYSPANRTIVVSSNAGIESVEIYSVGGVLEKRASGNGSIACTVDGVDSGVAIVRARTSEGTFTKKITVR